MSYLSKFYQSDALIVYAFFENIKRKMNFKTGVSFINIYKPVVHLNNANF